jgi:hypothetical protein
MSFLTAFVSTQYARYRALWRHGRELKPIVVRTGAIRNSDILLVTCLRNELTRLPYFCDYYRKLGVNQFLIVDNGSTDGVQDWARSQPDVSLWFTKASYKESKFGMEWCNYLLKKFGTGHLCVTVDPDEFLVYPSCDTRDLRDLGEFLKSEKREALHCVMLDAYSDKPLEQTLYRSGDNPFEVCPYFDGDGYMQESRRHAETATRGGPRMRVYNRKTPQKSPALNKVPVVWWRWNFRYTSSMHDIKPSRAMRIATDPRPMITGALFHFKFFASLSNKASEEMARKQHYNAGAEYQSYVETHNPLFYEEGLSVKHETPEQLIALGLISRGNWL